MTPRIAISMGDYNGIGPEVILKTMYASDLSQWTPIVVGSGKVFEFYANQLEFSVSLHIITGPNEVKENSLNLLECTNTEPIQVKPGQLSRHAGACSMQAVEEGIRWCMEGRASALVTAPISKEAINRAGYQVPGHTEFLAQKTGIKSYMMLLVHRGLRVGLVTIHIPVAKIASALTTKKILHHIQMMHRTLQDDFNIKRPHIAVLGLNPHAGDGGVIGTEEIKCITPALEQARAQQIDAEGPYPADGFFGNRKQKHYDGILAMYHDQGLVPFKTLSFGGGVNVTAGLSIVRTSPDHGTAFDIAGKNKADASSFKEALALAVTLSSNRLAEAHE